MLLLACHRPVKRCLRALLLGLLLSAATAVQADLRLYQYDGDMPFIQMMLNMMAAMGMIDRVPPSLVYGSLYGSPYGAGYSPYQRSPWLNSPWSSSPWQNSPWLNSPWSASGWQNPGLGSTTWGSPYWGVLPPESYSPYASTPYAEDSLLDGWVNEPWETSAWNPDAEPEQRSARQGGKQEETRQVAPQVTIQLQNNPPPATQPESRQPEDRAGQPSEQFGRQPSVRTPLARLAPRTAYGSSYGPSYGSSYGQAYGGQAYGQPPAASAQRQNKATARPKPPAPKQKPCITDFCGLAKPDLDGLWLSQNGEMLGIKNRHFLWSDSRSRYLSGRLKLGNDYLWVSIDETSDGPVAQPQVMQFKYKLAGNRLLTMQPDGVIKEFVRAPAY